MDRIDIERKENGFKLSCFSEGERFPKEYVFNDGDEMLTFIAEHFAIYRAESPQDTDSTETVEEAAEREAFGKAWDSIEPMADLSGVDYAPAFEGYQPNGSLPETD